MPVKNKGGQVGTPPDMGVAHLTLCHTGVTGEREVMLPNCGFPCYLPNKALTRDPIFLQGPLPKKQLPSVF